MNTNLLFPTTVAFGLLFAACGGSSTHSGDDDSSNAGTGGTSGTGGKGGTGGNVTSSATCPSLCEKAKNCPDATAEEKALDCTAQCDPIDRLVTASGCTSGWSAYLKCMSTGDICAVDVCSNQSTDFFNCISTFCTQNPMSQACLDVAGG